MQNEMRLEEENNIIHSVYHGDQTTATINEIAEAVKPVAVKWRSEGKPVYFLIDSSGIEHQDSGARKAAIDAINTLDYDKMAIFGASLFIKQVAQFLIKVS